MGAIEKIKLQLAAFFRKKFDGKTYLPLGAYETGNRIIFLSQNRVYPKTIDLAESEDGFSFSATGLITLPETMIGKPIESIHSFNDNGKHFFLIKQNPAGQSGSLLGNAENQILSPVSQINFTKETGFIVSDFRFNNQAVMYFGDRSIGIAYSEDYKQWKEKPKPVLIESGPLEIGGANLTDSGILLLYFKKQVENGQTYRSAYFALLDKQSPEKILWKTNQPVWRQKDQWPNMKARFLNMVSHQNRPVMYWFVNDEIIYAVVLTGFKYDPDSIFRSRKKTKLTKHQNNPIIAPNPKNDWEAFNTFNPAALYADKKVHILYRAQGFDYISSIGYAVSHNGINIDKRLERPVFAPKMDFENNKTSTVNYDFVSGGGYGGCEDPRITLVNDRVYMTYVAFDGCTPPRLALTSILLKDFLNHRWLWTKPVLISPPGIVDKSGCLLPEKINGKYVFFHRVFPNILIDFVDDLNFDGKTKWLRGQYQIRIRENMWDSRKIGAGAPPLKTEDGWLLIYYGVDDKDAGKYHVGAMLLDLKNPTKVLHRSNEPILGPTEEYENKGFKPGIAYPCGAVIIKNQLLVYYGGADSVVCVATADLKTFLSDLKTKEIAHLQPIQVREIDF